MKITTFLVSLCFVLIGVSTNAFNKINETKLFSNVATDPVMPSLQNLQNCGSSTFNLTVQTSIILAAQSGAASNYAVTYYLSQVNATTGTNPISNPSVYTSLNNQQVIYARVINNGTTQYAVGAFSLIVNSFILPMFNSLGPICQGDTAPILPTTSNNGIVGTWSPSIIDSSTVGTYTYMFTPSSGQCVGLLTMDIVVIPLPSIVYNAQYQECDDLVQDGITTFDLTAQVPMILGGQTGMTVNFYPSLTDATNNTNIIANPSFYNNTTPYLQTIGIRVTNASGCFRISSMNIQINPAPTINAPANFMTCDAGGTNDGFYPYNLSALIPGILGSQNPSNFTVNFYNDQASANSNTSVITNLSNYQTYTHNIWFRVTNNASGCYKISSFYTEVEQSPSPEIFTNNNINSFCVDYLTNTMTSIITLYTRNLTIYLASQNINSIPTYTYQWYLNGVPILGATSPYYTVPPFSNASSGSFSVRMISDSNCASVLSDSFMVFQSGSASPIGIGYTIVNNSGNQTITVNVQGYGLYSYSLDGGPQQTSNVFSNVSLGLHTITVTDLNGGCGALMLSNVDVNLTSTPAPTGNSSQSFSQGATLANMQVTGQNIQWYSGVNKTASSTPMPLSTVLVNGTTYYASQKIGGYESATRLPVTAQVSLSNTQFELKGLTYAPNPVKTNLNMKCDEIIDEVSVYNLLGQLVSKTKVLNSELQVDLSSLKSGNYFVKVSSGSSSSTFKIIKE